MDSIEKLYLLRERSVSLVDTRAARPSMVVDSYEHLRFEAVVVVI